MSSGKFITGISTDYLYYYSVSTSEDSDSSSCNTIDVKGRKSQFLSMCHQTYYQSQSHKGIRGIKVAFGLHVIRTHWDTRLAQ